MLTLLIPTSPHSPNTSNSLLRPIFMKHFRSNWVVHLFLALIMLIASSLSFAADDMAEEEYLMLPGFCRQQNLVAPMWWGKYMDSNLVPVWKNKLGDNYAHIHHHCWALLSMMRSYQLPSILTARGHTRKYLASIALGDFKYMSMRATADWIFWPELHTKSAEAFLIMQDERHALEEVRKSWAFDATYWQAYALWGQYLLSRGRFQESLATAQEGLKHSPNSRALKGLVKDVQDAMQKSRAAQPTTTNKP